MSSYADYVTYWFHLVASINANEDSLEQLVSTNLELETVAANARQLSIRQAALKAELTQTTKELRLAMTAGRDLATRLRNGIRSEFGSRSEKLLEFKMRPLRSRPHEESAEAGGGSTTPPPATE